MVIKQIDFTKFQPFNWKFLIIFIVAVIMILAAWSIGKWGFEKLKGIAPTHKVEEPTI